MILAKYFSYDLEGDGFVVHSSEQDAMNAANQALQESRKLAVEDGEWEDGEICWGEIREYMVPCDIDPETGFCDFKLKKVE